MQARSAVNSFIVTNLIGEYQRFDIYLSPLRLTPAVCASICLSKTITNCRGSAQVWGSCQKQLVCYASSSLKSKDIKFFSTFFFLKWVCSIIFLRDTPQLLHLRALCLVKLLSVRTKMAKLWVFAYYSSEERIVTIDLKNYLLGTQTLNKNISYGWHKPLLKNSSLNPRNQRKNVTAWCKYSSFLNKRAGAINSHSY